MNAPRRVVAAGAAGYLAINVSALLAEVKPRTVFDCVAYGAYSFETSGSLIS